MGVRDVRDVSGGVTLANATSAKLVGNDSVWSNEPLDWNPKLALPLSSPCQHCLYRKRKFSVVRTSPKWNPYLCFLHAEMKRFNINLLTPSHMNSSIFDLRYAHIFLALLWNTTKERRCRNFRTKVASAPRSETLHWFDKFIITRFQSSCFYLRMFDLGSEITWFSNSSPTFHRHSEKIPAEEKRRNTPRARATKIDLWTVAEKRKKKEWKKGNLPIKRSTTGFFLSSLSCLMTRRCKH